MKLIIDIPEYLYDAIMVNRFGVFSNAPCEVIRNGTPLANITDKQISDAFQLAIANYWEEKSKHLTPPPTPCNCPLQKPIKEEEE